MFFQEATPATSGYMIAGYAVAFIVMALYVASIYLRGRNLNRDIDMLNELDEPAPAVRPARSDQPQKSPAKPAGSKSAKTVTKKSRKK